MDLPAEMFWALTSVFWFCFPRSVLHIQTFVVKFWCPICDILSSGLRCLTSDFQLLRTDFRLLISWLWYLGSDFWVRICTSEFGFLRTSVVCFPARSSCDVRFLISCLLCSDFWLSTSNFVTAVVCFLTPELQVIIPGLRFVTLDCSFRVLWALQSADPWPCLWSGLLSSLQKLFSCLFCTSLSGDGRCNCGFGFKRPPTSLWKLFIVHSSKFFFLLGAGGENYGTPANKDVHNFYVQTYQQIIFHSIFSQSLCEPNSVLRNFTRDFGCLAAWIGEVHSLVLFRISCTSMYR